jgi:hypothetical protein
MCGAAIFCGILSPDKANSGPYLNSMHGNTTYGVDRTSLSSFAYSKGNCAHCHEQHAKIGGLEPAPVSSVRNYLLLRDNFNTDKDAHFYVQRDDVCFSCHIGTVTYQTPAFSNYSYSYTFGGCSAFNCSAANIFDAFNSLSYHNLWDVLNFAKGKWPSTFTADSNPCSACHNVHIAQKSCGKPSGSFDTTKAAISKPSDHSNLWGDDSPGERMTKPAYGTGYQPPYYYNSTNLEPDGASSVIAIQAEKTPDYVTFCTDCHNSTNTIYSNVLVRNLRTFNFAQEMHGGYAADYCSAYDHPPIVPQTLRSLLAPPYDGLSKCGQYVLACTDCHEPHGSPNNFLVRKQVNNGIVTVTSNGTGSADGRANKEWVNLCGKCHTGLLWEDLLFPHHDANTELTCTFCHGDDKGNSYKPCSDCHFHGNKMVIPRTGLNKPLF